jgi:hypothetical protein
MCSWIKGECASFRVFGETRLLYSPIGGRPRTRAKAFADVVTFLPTATLFVFVRRKDNTE